MQIPACRYSAPPEPDLIPKQPPSQPTAAASPGGGSSAAPGRLPGTPRAPRPCRGPFSQFVLDAPRIGTVEQARQCPPVLAPAALGSMAFPSAARGSQFPLHPQRRQPGPHQHSQNPPCSSQQAASHDNSHPSLPFHDLPFCRRCVYPNTGGFHPPLLQLLCHCAARGCTGACPDQPPRLLRRRFRGNYQVLETHTKKPQLVTQSLRAAHALLSHSLSLHRQGCKISPFTPTRALCAHKGCDTAHALVP